MRLVGHVAYMGNMKNTYGVLVAKLEGKRPHGRPRRSLKDNVRMYLKEIGWEGVDWLHLAQNRDQWRALMNTIMNLRVS
jgi:hypothetical protein